MLAADQSGLRQQQCSDPEIEPSSAGSQTDCLWCCTCPGWRPGLLGQCSRMLQPQSCLLQATQLWGRCRDRALPCLLLSGAGRSAHYHTIHPSGLPFLVKSLQHVVTCTSSRSLAFSSKPGAIAWHLICPLSTVTGSSALQAAWQVYPDACPDSQQRIMHGHPSSEGSALTLQWPPASLRRLALRSVTRMQP